MSIAASATIARAEAPLLTLGADGVLPLSLANPGPDEAQPQLELFGPGVSVSAGLLVPLGRVVLVGGRLRGGLLLQGDAPVDPGREDPGLGTFHSLSLLLRLRPFAPDGASRGTGFFIEGGAGAGITGRLLRPTLEGALGYGIPVGGINLAPVARYQQILQRAGAGVLDDRDARLVMLGLELSFFDRRAKAVDPAPLLPVTPPDRDGDGIADAADACPDEPEDFDGFQDADGCPELDNDLDGIADAEDACPNDPEDVDGFEDEDGCPDPDNDGDGILDVHDRCPDQPETINGVDDDDGCPDEGLFQMVDDRIVLEERVLFDFERARVKHGARPILAAIAALQAQHPEWVRIRIEGHADARGDTQFNLSLSERRAENVRKALIQMGIPEAIIVSEGYGATRLREQGDDEAAHQRNRRVEFVVVARRRVSPSGEEYIEDKDALAEIDPEQGDEEAPAEDDREQNDAALDTTADDADETPSSGGTASEVDDFLSEAGSE